MERHTKQKEVVYAALLALRSHPTADQVYDSIHRDHPRISKATVYRILRNMAAKGELLRIPVANGADRFDHNHSTHFHIFCDRCGRVEDIFDAELDQKVRTTGESTAYRFSGYELVFHGLCAECSEKGNCLSDTTVENIF